MSRGNLERGSVLATVALSLVVLLGFAALALDGGSAYNERRTTQNAADNTALAAAWAHCMGIADPIAHAQGVAAANGYDPTQVDIVNEGGASQYRASVTSITETTFARVIGTDEVTVVSEATAACVRTPGGGAFAMFAKGPGCNDDPALLKGGTTTVIGDVYSAGDIEWDGSGAQVFDGSMHSDSDITVNGTSLNITGSASATGTSNDPTVTWAEERDLDYPVDFEIGDFHPDAVSTLDNPSIADRYTGEYYHHTTNVRASDISALGRGVHFVEGDVVLGGQPLPLNDYTIVATGTIELNGAKLNAYHDGLAMMAGAHDPRSCNAAIDLGGDSAIAGLLFAPNGQLEVHGGAVNGGMIAWSIVTAGNLELDVDASLFPGGLPQVFLLR